VVTSDTGFFAIALYVPDATARVLSQNGSLGRLIGSAVPELDFLPPPWWEDSHTVRLGVVQAESTGVQDEENRVTD